MKKFSFYEVVVIRSERPTLLEVNGLKGAVLGVSENEKNERSYSIQIFDLNESWSVRESELVSTGKMMAREDFYDGEKVSVIVDERTGEGKLQES